jgi:hypothetical protein
MRPKTQIALFGVALTVLALGGTAVAAKSARHGSRTVSAPRDRAHGHGDELAAAAAYLGLGGPSRASPVRPDCLRVAAALPEPRRRRPAVATAVAARPMSGKSASGLVDALVAATARFGAGARPTCGSESRTS